MKNWGELTLGVRTIDGVKIIESLHATKTVEDWSRVRSPSRAARRLKRGFRQNIVRREEPAAFQIGDQMIVHPAILAELKRTMAKRIDSGFMRTMYFGSA